MIKGSIFKCPECNDKIFKTTVDLVTGMPLLASFFIGLQGVHLIEGCKTKCYKCNAGFTGFHLGQLKYWDDPKEINK